MVKFKLLAIAFFLSFQSCYVLFDQAVLSVPEDITNKGLRLDGYYYTIDKCSGGNSTFQINSYYVFYKNGVFMGGINYAIGNECNQIEPLLSKVNLDLKTCNFPNENSTAKGTIQISSDSIFLQSVGGRFGDCIRTYVGKVLNDTTFIITYGSSTRCAGDSYEERQPDTLNLLFHFRKFGPKPDSSAYTKYLLNANKKK